VTLLGESGSGKTTTLLMIAGFESPTQGRVVLDGRDLTKVPAHRRNLGMVFQNYALFPHMTVFDNVAFPLRRRSMSTAEINRRVRQALELVHLAELELRYPRELSGGQQQRVAVARATVYGPPVLLMDEPLSALDKKLRQSLQSEIRHIHQNLGTTIVYVTHDQEEALALSDRIALMREGRLEQVGTPQDAYERPRTVYAASFLGEANILSGRVLNVGSSTVIVMLGNGTRVEGVASEPAGIGDAVVVVVRPERLRQVDAGAPGVNVRVDEAVYLGQSVRCIGTFESGERAFIRIDAHDVGAVMATRAVRVGWEPLAATVLRSDESDRVSSPEHRATTPIGSARGDAP
jgi:putative spermidine/putrescine transport system ATP-binding protein